MPPLANDNPALRQAWHPVALSSELTDTPMRVMLLGEEWVVSRAGDGLLAFPNACPHRGAPLSEGKIIDGCLQCPYHGWTYAPDGTCVDVPAIAEKSSIPRRAHRPTPAGLTERYGIVWLAPEPPLTDLIELPEWDDPDFSFVNGGTTDWIAGAAHMVDNFLDLAHFPFTHLGTFGVASDRVVLPYEVERDGWRVHVNADHIAQSADPTVDEPEPRQQRFVYVAPFMVVLRLEYERSGDKLAILFGIQPVDATTSRLYRWNVRNTLAGSRRDPDAQAAQDALVIHEDRDLLQRMTNKAMPVDLVDELHTKADRCTVELRRVLSDFVAAASAPAAVAAPIPTIEVPMAKPLAGIHHVAICVDDLDVALAFYTGVLGTLGVEQVWRPDTLPNPGAWLQIGEQQVHLLAGPDRAPGTFQHFAIEVDDLRDIRDHLAPHGMELEGHQVVDEYGLQAFIKDPCGNVIEFYHRQWPLADEVLDAFGLRSLT
ncbi:MAG: Rieske 2Fe-2S domain-containing protein [Acidimicrobiia bacterium]